MARQLVIDLDALESEARHKMDVANDIREHADLYKAITADVEAWPYGAKTAPVDKWVWDHTVYPLEELQLEDDETIAGVVRFKAIQHKVADDFKKVVEAMTMGAMQPHEGGMFATDYMGFADIGPFALGCSTRATIEVGWADPEKVIPDVEPWHAWSAVDPTNEYWDTTIEVEGKKFGVKHWGRMSWHDFYTVLRNICAAGYERQVREVLGQETKAQKEAKEAAELEDKAAIINYDEMQDGIRVGYSKACHEVNKLFLREIVQDNPEYKLTYTPKPGKWEPKIELALPRDEIQAWRDAGGTPAQLMRLRGTIYTMLLHEDSRNWWVRYQITLTMGQIERALYNDADYHPTDEDRDLLMKSIELLTATNLVCEYPPKDRKKRHEHIDEESARIGGVALLPAIWVEKADARGHVVDAAVRFHAMPPLDAQSDEYNHTYTLPYLNGTKQLPKAKSRVETTAYDVETALGEYVRIAKKEGKVTVYIETLAREVEPFKYNDIEKQIKSCAYRGDMDEKRRQQNLLRKLRARVKRDVLTTLPVLIENEAIRESTPCYLSVDTAPGRRDGFVITRMRQTERQRKEHRKPNMRFTYGKKRVSRG